ncbi:MAG: hypothetical protein H8D87_01910 [Deltaproteobacteria bacterium]|uniref:hypothetical protein n=1 Tax=Desulfobacula sp. TaxID=2593537 RepID=UPI0019953652|nr:hypothetical protein [Candidatus Desulfobacula maris]MBL6996615.1 hypothetical protein [Desulfobacula sp.]
METVYIRRQFNDYRIAKIPFDGLSGIRWDTISGGVNNIAPQPFIHAYVWCDEVIGDIAHSCQHGPPPHSIKIVIVKKDNSPDIFKMISEIAGPKPKVYRAKPYNPKTDVKDICDALIKGKDHPAVEIKDHKIHGKIFVIKPKNMKKLIADGTANTLRARSHKVQLQIFINMKENSDFKEVQYGYWLTYKKNK